MSPAQAQQSFSSILDKPSNEAERPKPLPQGTYVGVVSGMPRLDKSSKKQTEFAEFTLNILAAQEDVDPDELKAIGGFSGKSIKSTYYLTEASEYRLREFLDHCGVPDEEDGEALSHRQRMEQTPGKQVLLTVKHTASDDGRSVYANVAGTASVE